MINPWGSDIVDVERLIKEFGLKRIDDSIREKLRGEFLMDREILVAHRDFDRFLKDMKKKKSAALSGIKPSGRFHLGSVRPAMELIMFQRMGLQVFYVIADIEAYADNGQDYKTSERLAVDNVADLLALGLDPERAYIYRQSREVRVHQLAGLFAPHITMATLRAVYGERNMGLYMAAMVQMGDIYLPQHEDFGYENIVIPVGLDQDPHIRLARDLADKPHGLNLSRPAAIYHDLIRGLDNSTKMSKRNPDAVVTLEETEESLKRKLAKAFTGGRDTAEEQRRLGGRPDICPVFKLSWEFFDRNLERVEDRRKRCLEGKLLCGPCKKETLEVVMDFLKEHREKKKGLMDTAEKIVKGKY